MTTVQFVQRAGFESVAELARFLGKNRLTIYNWHRDNPVLFEAVLVGAGHIKRRDGTLSPP